mgnify:CR=1 FL=1
MKANFTLVFILITSIVFSQITQFKDINVGSGNSSPANMFVFNGKLYFTADDSSGQSSGGTDFGKELWVSDGTNSGTTLIKDIRTGTRGSSPFAFFALNNTLYFSANDGTGADLWTSDGTDSGTTKVDLFPGVGEAVQRPVELDGVIYLTGITAPGSINDLIIFDGTSGIKAPDSNSDATANVNILSTMATLNDKLLLYMSYSPDNATLGNELYEYNPATAIYTLIKDINVGTGSSSISALTTLSNKVYFEANDNLWETDGTESGTKLVTVANSIEKPTSLFAWNNSLYFEGDDGTGDQLWVFNPIANTVTKLSAISGTNTNHDPSNFTVFDSYLYYRGEDANDTKGHLFRTDGTLVEQVDNEIIDVDAIVVFDNKLFFEGDNGTDGNELFVLDPTTLSIEDVVSTFEDSLIIYSDNNQIYIISDFTGKTTYSIYDLSGKQVENKLMEQNTITHNLTVGVYILQLNNNSKIASKKVVIH